MFSAIDNSLKGNKTNGLWLENHKPSCEVLATADRINLAR